MDRTYAEETVARAVKVLGDVRADDDDREDAASVIQVLIRRAHPTEADLTDVIAALSRALEVNLAIRRVLGELQRLRPAEVEKAGHSVERLMGQAFREDRAVALYQLVLVSLEEPAWAARIRDEVGKAVLIHAIGNLPERKYPVALLIGGWLWAQGDVPAWMREVVEERPDLITSGALPVATRWQLHTAAPSVTGWRSLAGLSGEKPTLEASTFGSWLDVAVETLQQALGETTDEGRKTMLHRWLVELTGMGT